MTPPLLLLMQLLAEEETKCEQKFLLSLLLWLPHCSF
jgi:hypothetical protein